MQGRQKLDMQWMTPTWPWILNNDEYSAGTKDLPLRLRSILLYDHWFSRYMYKVAQKSELHVNDCKLNLNT